MRKIALLSLIPLLAATLSVHAQPRPSWQIDSCNGNIGNTHNYSFFGPKLQVCQLRRTLLPARDQLNIQNRNGGIQVFGQERNTIAIEARVIVKVGSRAQAERIERQIKIETDGTIRAEGPTSGLFGPDWYVNYRLFVPEKLAAQIKTENGGIDLHHLQGTVQAHTTNGGLTLDALAGNVDASTVNGGIDVRLSGSTWQGTGLTVHTTNGGINIKAAPDYSAHLILQTVNGGVSIHLPNTNFNIHHNHFDGNLGHGGPTIEFHSVNGGISLNPE
jgi:hypothetical protein